MTSRQEYKIQKIFVQIARLARELLLEVIHGLNKEFLQEAHRVLCFCIRISENNMGVSFVCGSSKLDKSC